MNTVPLLRAAGRRQIAEAPGKGGAALAGFQGERCHERTINTVTRAFHTGRSADPSG